MAERESLFISNVETDAVGRQNYDDAQGVHARVTFYPNDIADSAIRTVHFGTRIRMQAF